MSMMIDLFQLPPIREMITLTDYIVLFYDPIIRATTKDNLECAFHYKDTPNITDDFESFSFSTKRMRGESAISSIDEGAMQARYILSEMGLLGCGDYSIKVSFSGGVEIAGSDLRKFLEGFKNLISERGEYVDYTSK